METYKQIETHCSTTNTSIQDPEHKASMSSAGASSENIGKLLLALLQGQAMMDVKNGTISLKKQDSDLTAVAKGNQIEETSNTSLNMHETVGDDTDTSSDDEYPWITYESRYGS